jgi:hypothetical protein
VPSADQTSQDTGQTEHAKNEAMMALWTRRVGQFTLLLVIVTGISDFFIFKQWRIATEQMQDTREQLKAYIAPPNVGGITQNDKDGKPIIYAFFTRFQNSGGTRTANMRAWASVHYFEGTVPNSHDTSKPWNAIPVTPTITIGGNSGISLSPVTITPDEARHALNKDGVVLLWGYAEYANVFEPIKMHHIRFCYLMNAATDASGNIGFQQQPYKDECNASD